MKQIFCLSKKDLNLSKFEVLRLYKPKKYELIDDLLVFDSKKDHSNRLAYTKQVFRFLFRCKENELSKELETFNWNKVYEKSFLVRFVDNTKDEKKVADVIYNKLTNPKVDLKNAYTKVVLLKKGDTVICGLLTYENDNKFLERKAHLRPELHPTSLHPQLAIACINMTGIVKGKLLDPFCGSGGILIEAGLLGFDVYGYDIDRIMINRSKINLEHFKIKKFSLKIHDATKIYEKFDCLVTDLPYGRNSKVSDHLVKLYKKFLESAYAKADTAVVLFPDFIDYKKLLGKWVEKKTFDYYLHKSLSKKIVVLEK